MSTLIENGYPIFTDANGDPLDDGYIFIGEAGLNPISNPQTAYWDADLTIPAANIRTSGGYPVYNGSPSRLYVADNYSIVVQDKKKQTVYTLLDATGFVVTPSPSVGFDNTQVEVKAAATITVKAGSTADVNGTSVEVLTDTDLTISLADTDYYIRLTSGGALSLTTDPGAWDFDLNGRYLAGDRILNWKVYRDSTASYVGKVYDPYNLNSADQSIGNGKPLNTGQGDNFLYPMDQGVQTTDDVEFNQLSLTSYFLPRVREYGLFSLSIGETQTIPRGIYLVRLVNVAGEVRVQFKDNASGFQTFMSYVPASPQLSSSGGMFASDGVNVVITNLSGASLNLPYARF